MRRYESLRASDADRDRVTDRLREAAGEGRLEPDELEERVAAALRSRTYGELGRLVADLPRDGAGSRRSSRLGPGALARPALVGAGLIAAITIVVVLVALVALLVLAAAVVAATWWIACVLVWVLCRRWRRRFAGGAAWHGDARARHMRRARPSGLL
jgi:Flp pilus assembly protein TadB